jgi:hypothetical protein
MSHHRRADPAAGLLGGNGAKARQEGDRAHCHHRDRCAKTSRKCQVIFKFSDCKDESGVYNCKDESKTTWGGGSIFNRAPALRRSVCALRVPRPKPRLPEEVGLPCGRPPPVPRVAGGAPRDSPARGEPEASPAATTAESAAP